METKTDEFTPRAYQIDLYEKAVSGNTIIYLPTGAGKTFIAVMLIKRLSADIQKPYSEGGKHTVFAVNTVPLVMQQSEYIARLTGLPCGAYSGDMQVDYWTETEWEEQLEENQVLVMTSQVFLDVLCHGYMQLNRINLIIFDECHRAVNDHPMRQIMQHFENCPEREQPRILAMSATLLNSNVKVEKVTATIRSLEVTFHAKIATVDSAAHIKGYYATPNETMVPFDKYVMPNIGKRVNDVIDEMNKVLKSVVLNNSYSNNQSSAVFKPKSKNSKLISLLSDIQEQFLHTGIYGASKSILLHLIQLECIRKYTDDTQTAYVLEYLVTEMTKLRKLLEDEMEGTTELERIHKYSSDKVRKLFAVLENFHNSTSNDQKFCCIIFVQRRFTAKVLYHILKNLHTHNEKYKFLLPDFIVGFSNDPYRNAREVLCISKWNKEVLHRFRNGFSNCIIATDVVDEGIDVSTCTLIVRYDLPMDIRAYIQSKGRARSSSSQYILLLREGDTDYIKRYHNFKNTESYLQKILVGQTEYRSTPKLEDIENELYQHEIEPYIVISEDGSKSVVTEQAAISLINRYCSLLLKSKFVHLAPTWILHEIEGGAINGQNKLYKVSLKLPIVSTVKETVFGDPMDSIDSAKRSAALKMCIQLHKSGELSDKLLPNSMNSVAISDDYLLPHWVNEDQSETAKVGTSKNKRSYKIQFPTVLYGAYPQTNNVLYLHILHAKPMYLIPHDNRHLVFYNLLSNNAGFGILSTKPMPKIPSFPIFMNVGELNVDVKVNHVTMRLSEEQIGYMKVFHTMMFSQIVPVIKNFMVFDNDCLDNCFLVVPVNENEEINWDVITNYQCIDRISPSMPFHFKNSDYDLALVVPSYRGSANVYIVTQVCDELTPDSCFPTEEFYSYTHYYKERHDLTIHNPKQPMLEVKPISMKINCIKPRSLKPGLSKRKRADLLEDFEEHLVPELCIKINFPALYWLKTTMLPSILHRISQLLIAEDLRTTIVMEAKIGSLHPPHQTWPALIITDEEREEPFEPSEIPTDEIIRSSNVEPSLSGPEVDVLNTEANQYPWSKDQEPSDLDRNIEQIQMIDIEYYCQFMHAGSDPNTNVLKSKRVHFMNKPTIQVPPLKIFSIKDSYGPDPIQIMYALTSKLGNDAFDLERLETLGDSYLKFITSLFLYNHFPTYNEGRLTALKCKIIGNRNLYYCGTDKSIPGRMKVDEFVPLSNFIAPAYTTFRQLQQVLLDAEVSPSVLYELNIPMEERFTGYISETTRDVMLEKVMSWDVANSQTGMEHFLGIQTVPDKAVADCVEALIGVYLRSMGLKGAATLLKWFGILPNELSIDQLLYGTPENPVICEGNLDLHMPWASKIEEKLGYQFKNRAFLLQAFTHPSYTANSITECYQRLEFLGDAILDFLITCYIYETCGNLTPGALTDLRSALVNNITFACLAVRYGLHTGLLAYAPKLNDIIDRFVKFQEERNHVIDDELLWVLLEEEECNMAEYVDVPKVLGDLFESVIGAIYLDCDKSLLKVWEIVYSLMYKEIDEFSKNIPKQPLRVLYETQGAHPQFSTATRIEGTNTVMVPLKVTIAGKVKLFHGFGTNKKQAKCAAAKQALKSFLRKT